MRLILTLLCRNEIDIVGSVIDFHLSRGVDLIIATDNGSIDGTDLCLEGYQRRGVLRLLREPSHTHDQSKWVTRMARLAAEEHGADWVINSDADEFWWASSGDLKNELAAIPESVHALVVERSNFLPPAPNVSIDLPFHQLQTTRERRSFTSLGEPIVPKVCHRAHTAIVVGDGNHAVKLGGQTVPAQPCAALEILHFPVRSYTHLERKIREGTEALVRNTRVTSRVGRAWRHIYNNHLLAGTLPAYYAGLRPPPTVLEAGLLSGDLVNDLRLQKAMADLASRW